MLGSASSCFEDFSGSVLNKMFHNGYLQYYNNSGYYGNNNYRNNRQTFDSNSKNSNGTQSPSNSNAQPDRSGPPHYNTFPAQKKWPDRWYPRNLRDNSDSSPRHRRDPEPLNDPIHQGEPKGTKPKARTNPKSSQQQQQQQDQQQVKPAPKEEADTKNKAGEEKQDQRENGASNEPKGRYKNHIKPIRNERPLNGNGERNFHGNGRRQGFYSDRECNQQCHYRPASEGIIYSDRECNQQCHYRPASEGIIYYYREYCQQCLHLLDSEGIIGRPQNNQSSSNYNGTHLVPPAQNQQQNCYKQWDDSGIPKSNNTRNNHYNSHCSSNKHHNNNYHPISGSYTVVRSKSSEKQLWGPQQAQGPERSPQDHGRHPRGPGRNPQGLERCPQGHPAPPFLQGGLTYNSVVQNPLYPNCHLTAAIYALQRFSSEMEISAEARREPPGLIKGSIWDELSADMWSKFLKNQQCSDVLVNKINAWGLFYNSMKEICGDTHRLFAPDRNTDTSAFDGDTAELYLVGSTYTGFGLNSSDVDTCCMITTSGAENPYYQSLKFLQMLRDKIVSTRIESGLDVDNDTLNLVYARVPVLKFVGMHSRVQFDVNCNNPVGVRNTHLLFHYCKTDWRVQPLVILVKLWAKFHGINNAKDMTLSSYSLTLMVIHYLQCGTRPAVLPCLQKMYDIFSPEQPLNVLSVLNFPHKKLEVSNYSSSNGQTLGELLVGFFEYFSTFNFARDAISVRIGAIIAVDSCRSGTSPKNDTMQWKHISIEEPFERTNTARAVYDLDKFQEILQVFRESAKILAQTKQLESIFTRIVPASQAVNIPAVHDLAVNNQAVNDPAVNNPAKGRVPSPPFRQ